MTGRLAVGWDVGGWQGRNQAIAILRYEDDRWNWFGEARAFSLTELPADNTSLVDFIRMGCKDAPDDVLDRYNVTIAIDALLGLPLAFQKFVAGERIDRPLTKKYIDNSLSFRTTDQSVHSTYCKMPLSASFDKLGNNSTVAITYANAWSRQHGVAVLPFDAPVDHRHVAIEVYPALVKVPGTTECMARFNQFMQGTENLISHARDAAICAVFASAWPHPRLADSGSPLRLLGPDADMDMETISAEGWIYAPPRDWLNPRQQVE